MIRAYFNYPNSRVVLHEQPDCLEVKKAGKVGQRDVLIDAKTFGEERIRFANRGYPMGSTAPTNDLWLSVDFDDLNFERAVIQHIHRLLGQHYRPLGAAVLSTHCSQTA